MHVHLAVPDLFWPEPGAAARAAGFDRLPALERLVARGRRRVGEGTSLEAWLLAQWGAPAGSGAPYCLLADGGEPGAAFWLRADPCHLRVERDQVVPLDVTLFDLERDEADALVAALNEHYAAAGLRFVAPQPHRWYLAAPPEAAPPLPPLPAARGRPLAVQASGPRLRGHALANEIQMLLHAHPVNARREARGVPTINGLWLWGGGRLAVPARSPFARVRTAEPLAAGLALAAGASVQPLPEEASRWLRAAASDGAELIVLDRLRAAADYGDRPLWRDRLKELEAVWFAPLCEALRAGRLGMISLHALGIRGALDVETTRQDLRYFWRRARPLVDYLR